jgi:membrane associated rhomboid family serine protease
MLFVPVWDMNHLKSVKFQYVTVGIMLANTIIYFVFETNLFFSFAGALIGKFSFAPKDAASFGSMDHWAQQFKLVTYMFLHGSLWHLAGNMLFLFVFGDNVEDAMGHVRFILFYLLCGISAALVHSFMTSAPDLPLIGASGAVSGVIGAYLMLHPKVRVWVLFPLPNLPFLPLRFSAGFVIGIWIIYQIVSAFFIRTASTAWWAHVGGFVTGSLLIFFMKRPGVRLFDKATGV